MIVIDADILIDVLRQYTPAVAWLDSLREPPFVADVAALELFQGCRDAAGLRQTTALLSRHDLVWPTTVDCERAISRFGEQHLRFGLDVSDALIAETAIGLDAVLHTFNSRHFAAYPELQTIQPYTKA